MAKFDLSAVIRDHASFAGHLILSTMTSVTEKLRLNGEESDINKVFKLERDAEGKLNADVVVTINGVEVPFGEFVESLEKHLDRMAVARAQVLIKERLRDFNEKLYNVERNIERVARDAFQDVDEDEWR